ncbi:hypothetical protein DL89DRAFT_4822 [Linderina pennispora]|uniref:Uncharacterized protein n=1 Tax=Linderina pennispora TaxID=61395 RepID=A0A1Y1WKW8_9FUNG|nr:uncharacterized protein DL89DRAFT_4822 [Linderina pennispora]ORX73846.1 hypothetical protein DL89DRAFT_4822 [Linderina pennispora]
MIFPTARFCATCIPSIFANTIFRSFRGVGFKGVPGTGHIACLVVHAEQMAARLFIDTSSFEVIQSDTVVPEAGSCFSGAHVNYIIGVRFVNNYMGVFVSPFTQAHNGVVVNNATGNEWHAVKLLRQNTNMLTSAISDDFAIVNEKQMHILIPSGNLSSTCVKL